VAEETPLDLEKIGEVTDDAALQAEIERLKGAPTGTTEAVEAAPPSVEVRPADGELAPAAPTAETKPVETKPAEEASRPRDDAAWKRVRLLEKELAAERARREATAETPPVPKGPPAYEDDPAEHLKARTGALESEINRLKAENAQKEQFNNIRSQEADFERIKPDYKKALGFLESAEVKDWEKAGLATVGVRNLTAAVAAGRRGDAAYKPYAEHIDRVAAQPHVQEMATKGNQDPEDVAMYLVARDTYLTSRRQLVWQGAEATGRNPAEIAYDLALARGYTPAEAEAAVAAQAAKPAEDGAAARAKVLAQKQVSEAANSLSESASGETAAQPRVLRSRNEVLGLDDNNLDALIQSGQYRNI